MRHFFIVFHQALPVHKTHHNSPWLFLIQRSLRHLLSEILTAIPIYHIFISFPLCMNYISKWFFQDFDNDGWLDLFVIGDFGQSKMFWNKKDGTFTECTVACGINGTQVSVGTVGGGRREESLDFNWKYYLSANSVKFSGLSEESFSSFLVVFSQINLSTI